MVRAHPQERERVTEDAIWSDILAHLGTHPEEPPSAQAVQAVLQRVERIEIRIARSSCDTPTRERLLPPAKTVQMLIEDAIAAVAYNGIEVAGKLVVAPPHEVKASVTAALNRYPRTDSLMARYVLPILRRRLTPLPGPDWYFALMEDYRQAKRTRPFLFPRGSKAPRSSSLSPNYGWHRLELWTMTAYLAMEEDLCRGTATFSHDKERLRGLVGYATARLRALANTPPVDAPGVMEFDELCAPLRRFLVWNVTNPRAPIQGRRLCSRLLENLHRTMLPRLPKRPPADVRWYHKKSYEMLLDALRRIWRETDGDQTDEVRRDQMKEALPVLGLRPTDPALQAAQREFWSRCGDLIKTKPHLVASHFLGAFKQVPLSPQALRAALGKVSPAPPGLDESGLPYAVQYRRRRGKSAEEVSRVIPIEFV